MICSSVQPIPRSSANVLGAVAVITSSVDAGAVTVALASAVAASADITPVPACILVPSIVTPANASVDACCAVLPPPNGLSSYALRTLRSVALSTKP